ncbi:MAG: hypothetical protein H7Z73_12300 [Candidatus Saccharibacteria bacterium]|nr:hypothetical protein [Moraxellaceae bacterium]
MISSFITPEKIMFSKRNQEKFDEFFQAGKEITRLHPGESGGTPSFYAGNVKTQDVKKPQQVRSSTNNC